MPYPWNQIQNPQVLPAGKLRDFVQIQSPSSTQDGYGQPTDAWPAFASMLGALEAVRQRETYQTGQFSSEYTHKIIVRWPGPNVTILRGMRAIVDSHIYLIQDVENFDTRNRIVILHCTAINDATN
jgi:SPP1 family predicted phage head-tail adaptor